MEIITKITAMQNYVLSEKSFGKTIGLVPTMGFLHKGHMSLMQAAKKDNDLVVASIFVNPIQFGLGEDYESYPRDLAKDAELAESAGVDILFVPETKEMYPQDYQTFVDVEKLTDFMCGASRPGHFQGVTTVVNKLFNIAQPNRAYFGQKDAQQAAIIKKMVANLNMPLEIITMPIIREEDGLALSSRNVNLSAEERQQSLVLSHSLQKAETLITAGEKDADKIREAIRQVIAVSPLANLDYVAIVNAEDLTEIKVLTGKILIALAVKFPSARLIDNIILEVK